MLNKKSKVSFDFGFFGIIPFLIDFSSFPLKNSRRLSLKLLSSMVLYMCSPTARTWEGVRANINQTWALNNPLF